MATKSPSLPSVASLASQLTSLCKAVESLKTRHARGRTKKAAPHKPPKSKKKAPKTKSEIAERIAKMNAAKAAKRAARTGTPARAPAHEKVHAPPAQEQRELRELAAMISSCEPPDAAACTYHLKKAACATKTEIQISGSKQNVPGRFCLVDIHELQASNLVAPQFPTNPKYLKALKERSSPLEIEAGVSKIVKDPGLHQEKSIQTKFAATDSRAGLPVVLEDGMVLSGNGYVMAIFAHYAAHAVAGNPSPYRAALLNLAPELGFPRVVVEQVKYPIIVRVVRPAKKYRTEKRLALLAHELRGTKRGKLSGIGMKLATAARTIKLPPPPDQNATVPPPESVIQEIENEETSHGHNISGVIIPQGEIIVHHRGRPKGRGNIKPAHKPLHRVVLEEKKSSALSADESAQIKQIAQAAVAEAMKQAAAD